MRRSPAMLLLAALGAGLAPAAEPGLSLAPPGSTSWRPLVFPKVQRTTRYTAVEDEGLAAVRAESDCAASALYLPLEDVDLRATPRLSWRWRIAAGPEVADERTKRTDDFAARVYVTFRFDPSHASLVERLGRRVARAVWGATLPGDTLNYVWSSRLPAGTTWTSPYAASSRIVSLGRGPLLHWRRETVDVAADYRARFGRPPPAPLAVALMTDSDDTCGHAVAYYADFRLLGPDGPAATPAGSGRSSAPGSPSSRRPAP